LNETVSEVLCRDKAATVKPLSLPLNCSWVALGNAVDMVAQWGRVVVLLHLGGEVMIGTLALAFAVCAPVYAMASLGLRGAVATDAKHEYQFADYLALRLVTSMLALLVVAAIVLLSGYERETALLILLVGAGELFKAISDVFHALQQQNERMDRLAISLMIRGPSVVLVLALGVWWTGSLLWAVAGFPLVTLATLLIYDLPNGRRMIGALKSDALKSPSGRTLHPAGLKPRWDLRTLLRLAWLSAPLGVVVMIIALQVSVPRYMVNYYLGRHALGVFVSILYLGMVGGKVVSSIGESANPRLAKYFAAGDVAAYCRLLGKLIVLVVGLGLATVAGILLLGGPILALLYKAEFARHAGLAAYLMVAVAAGYLAHPLSIGLAAMRRFKTQMFTSGVGIALLLAASPIFVPRYGLRGMALAMLTSSMGAVIVRVIAIFWAIQRRRTEVSADLPVDEPARRAA